MTVIATLLLELVVCAKVKVSSLDTFWFASFRVV